MRIIRPDGTIIEGSPDELARYEGSLELSRTTTGQLPSLPTGNDGGYENFDFVSVAVALRVMTRIKLHSNQLKVLQVLYKAGEAWVPATELQKEILYTPSQFAGLMGAFGRRLIHTPGWVAGSAFFDQDWDEAKICYLYRLPNSVLEAMRSANLAPEQ